MSNEHLCTYFYEDPTISSILQAEYKAKINDSRVSAAIFREWEIRLWTFISRHFFWEVWGWKICKQKEKRATKLSLKQTLRKVWKDMVRKDRCCVGICNNDRSYPDKREIKSHVQILKWHRFPKDKAKRKWWQTLVNKGKILQHQMNLEYVPIILLTGSQQKNTPTRHYYWLSRTTGSEF